MTDTGSWLPPFASLLIYLNWGVHVPSEYLKGIVEGEKLTDGVVTGRVVAILVGVNVSLFSFPNKPIPILFKADPDPPV